MLLGIYWAVVLAGLVYVAYLCWISAPGRYVYRTQWRAEHSRNALAREMRKAAKDVRWTHAGPDLDRFGNKEIVAQIMALLQGGSRFGNGGGLCPYCMGPALRRITNQEISCEAGSWLQWWSTNQEKSQEEWIRAGFRPYGVALDDVLTRTNAILLLCLLDTSRTDSVPDHVRFNAYRWLRDNDFPANESGKALMGTQMSAAASAGLLQYARMLRQEIGNDTGSPLALLPPPREGYNAEAARRWVEEDIRSGRWWNDCVLRELGVPPWGITDLLTAIVVFSVLLAMLWQAWRGGSGRFLELTVIYTLVSGAILLGNLYSWFGEHMTIVLSLASFLCAAALLLALTMPAWLLFLIRRKKGEPFKLPKGTLTSLVVFLNLFFLVACIIVILGL